jgi:hypothetical protein
MRSIKEIIDSFRLIFHFTSIIFNLAAFSKYDDHGILSNAIISFMVDFYFFQKEKSKSREINVVLYKIYKMQGLKFLPSCHEASPFVLFLIIKEKRTQPGPKRIPTTQSRNNQCAMIAFNSNGLIHPSNNKSPPSTKELHFSSFRNSSQKREERRKENECCCHRTVLSPLP